jgi:hypothetical protein
MAKKGDKETTVKSILDETPVFIPADAETEVVITTETAQIGGKETTVKSIDTYKQNLPERGEADGFSIYEMVDKGSSWGMGHYNIVYTERKRLPNDGVTLKGVNDGCIKKVEV